MPPDTKREAQQQGLVFSLDSRTVSTRSPSPAPVGGYMDYAHVKVRMSRNKVLGSIPHETALSILLRAFFSALLLGSLPLFSC